jgi:hypothetical protein
MSALESFAEKISYRPIGLKERWGKHRGIVPKIPSYSSRRMQKMVFASVFFIAVCS